MSPHVLNVKLHTSCISQNALLPALLQHLPPLRPHAKVHFLLLIFNLTLIKDCSNNCSQCSSASVCTECQSPYLIYQSECFASCPVATFAATETTCEGTLLLIFNLTHIKDCPANCHQCSDAFVCTECQRPYYLHQSECFASCPVATFAATETTCEGTLLSFDI